MDDFKKYNDIIKSGASEKKNQWFGYIIIKLTDNFLSAAVFFLCILFVSLALFIDNDDGKKMDWCLHAAELCLGVFLGLLKKRK